MASAQEILEFWFEHLDDSQKIHHSLPHVRKWFTKNAQFDNTIRERFETDLINARQGQYKAWEHSAIGCLALILLFDQFSRNLYRNTPAMFATDSVALDLTRRCIEEGLDNQLPLIYRVFLYMPLMHAEDLEVQELSMKAFQILVDESKLKSPQSVPYFEYTLAYAKRHRDIIKQFGRFPHRNKILARPSTAEEEIFLTKPGSSF
jgi:uncharacterized protein (DUF924 family)